MFRCLTARDWLDVLPVAQIEQLDERLQRSVKYVHLNLFDYQTASVVAHELDGYFQFYNTARPHQSLGLSHTGGGTLRRERSLLYFTVSWSRQRDQTYWTG